MEEKMSFIGHIRVMRKYIIRIAIIFVIGFIIAFSNYSFIFDNIILSLKDTNFITYRYLCLLSEYLNLSDALCIKNIPITIQNRVLSGQFLSHIRISAIAGFIISSPFILLQLWFFVRPALKQTEIKKLRLIYLSILSLFIIGILFGYYIITPLSINFLGNYSVSAEIKNEIDLTSFIGVIASIIIASGIVFLLPVFIYFLTMIGFIDDIFLKKYRKHSIVVIFIFSAIITPPDISSQVLIALPLILLYELGIVISRRASKKHCNL